MAKKFKFGFNDIKNWKTKFRLVLLIPLVIVMFYIASNLIITGSPTGQLIGAPKDVSNGDSYTVTDFKKNNVENDDLNQEEEPIQNDDENIIENRENTTPAISLSGGGSSGIPTTTDTNDEVLNNSPKDDDGCTKAPRTETIIETVNNAEPPSLSDFAGYWGTVTIDETSVGDWLNVTATMLNGTIISKTQTCQGYYDIGIPHTGETEIIILVDGKEGTRINWSSGMHREDIRI